MASKIDLVGVAKACGYPYAVKVDNLSDLDKALSAAKVRSGLSFLEVACAIGARENLGRPTNIPVDNKKMFMSYLRNLR